MRTGLVLGAGGFAGEAFHRGVIRAMDDVGIDPRASDVVLGTSAGSVTAASLRRHATTPLQVVQRRASGVLPARHEFLRLLRTPRQRINAALLWPEFTSGRRDLTFLREGVRRVAGEQWPEAPLWIVAIRRNDGQRVVFGQPGAPTTDIASAVAASCAIPGYFTPIEINGVEYVDGGVHSPTNADLIAECALDLVIVSSPMSVDRRDASPRLDLPIRAWFGRILREEIWALRQHDLRLIVIEPDRPTMHAMGLNMMREHRLDEIEERAHAHARHCLDTVLHGNPPRARP